MEREWRGNGSIERENDKKEKTWRGRKSFSLQFPHSLSIFFLFLSPLFHSLFISFPFSRLLSISSSFSDSLAIFSEAALQLPAGCASLRKTSFFTQANATVWCSVATVTLHLTTYQCMLKHITQPTELKATYGKALKTCCNVPSARCHPGTLTETPPSCCEAEI